MTTVLWSTTHTPPHMQNLARWATFRCGITAGPVTLHAEHWSVLRNQIRSLAYIYSPHGRSGRSHWSMPAAGVSGHARGGTMCAVSSALSVAKWKQGWRLVFWSLSTLSSPTLFDRCCDILLCSFLVQASKSTVECQFTRGFHWVSHEHYRRTLIIFIGHRESGAAPPCIWCLTSPLYYNKKKLTMQN